MEKKPAVQLEKKGIAEHKLKKSVSKGKTSQEMMCNHIMDQQDVITDEDFKNLKLDLELPADEAHQPLDMDDPERPKEVDKVPKVIIAWDVIK